MADKLVLDLETKKSFDEVGGQRNAHLLGVSLVGIYSYDRDEYRSFRESEFAEMEEWLRKAGLIIGFNSKRFDFEVLQPYFRWKLNKLPHLDILEEIHNTIGHRLRLDSIATTTLGEGKSGNGLDAIWYYKNNQWDKLARYCLDDVRVTREVYEYGQRHGQLWYEAAGRRVPIKVRWATENTVKDILNEAMKFGSRIRIEYLATDNNKKRAQNEIDVREIKGEKLMGFCHLTGQEMQLEVPRIFTIEILGQSQSFQESLF
ncbi:MAG: ribonuclease H-like domain-containing protein [Candidatus Komeilibacteria bacterium]|nr:ribonuclease H-like domain-containing protein [Candidatus Komeilibacteria bacterium]